MTVNTHGCLIIVYKGRYGKAVTVTQQRNYAGLTGYRVIVQFSDTL